MKMNMCIDRIGLIRPIESKEMHGHFSGFLAAMKGQAGCKVWKSKYKTLATAALSPTEPGGYTETVRFQIGISHHKPYFKVDFRPGDLSADQWGQLHMHMEPMLDFGYQSLLAESRVSYLEVAVDCPVAVKALLPFRH